MRIWDPVTGKLLHKSPYAAGNKQQQKLRFTPDGKTIALIGPDNFVTMDTATWKLSKPVPRKAGNYFLQLSSLDSFLQPSPDGKPDFSPDGNFSPDGKRLARGVVPIKPRVAIRG